MWQRLVSFSRSWASYAILAVVMIFAAVLSFVGRDGGFAVAFAVVFLILAVSNAMRAYSLYRRPGQQPRLHLEQRHRLDPPRGRLGRGADDEIEQVDREIVGQQHRPGRGRLLRSAGQDGPELCP